jgi:DNA polymerase III delta prime subunit
MPGGQKVTWKDLRSSMACDLLKKGWSRDEVNARLGHKPSSRIIDRYINFLALDRNKPKKKVFESNLKKIEEELATSIEFGKLQGQRIQKQEEKLSSIKKSYSELEMQFNSIQEKLNSLEKGKGFMVLITGLLNQQRKMSKTLEKISGKNFDIVLPV